VKRSVVVFDLDCWVNGNGYEGAQGFQVAVGAEPDCLRGVFCGEHEVGGAGHCLE
jgi:hypothetical protein